MLAALVPSPRDAWVRAHAAELECVEGRWSRLVWRLGVVPIAGWALMSQLRHDPRSFLGGVLVATIVVGLSFLNLVAGIGLLVLYLVEANPWLVLVLGIGLCAQGGYSLAYILGAFGRRRALARRVQLAGSGLASVVGLTGFVAGIVANVNPANNDPEYGPMTIALLVTVHGLASLLAFSGDPNPRTPSAQRP